MVLPNSRYRFFQADMKEKTAMGDKSSASDSSHTRPQFSDNTRTMNYSQMAETFFHTARRNRTLKRSKDKRPQDLLEYLFEKLMNSRDSEKVLDQIIDLITRNRDLANHYFTKKDRNVMELAKQLHLSKYFIKALENLGARERQFKMGQDFDPRSTQTPSMGMRRSF